MVYMLGVNKKSEYKLYQNNKSKYYFMLDDIDIFK